VEGPFFPGVLRRSVMSPQDDPQPQTDEKL